MYYKSPGYLNPLKASSSFVLNEAPTLVHAYAERVDEESKRGWEKRKRTKRKKKSRDRCLERRKTHGDLHKSFSVISRVYRLGQARKGEGKKRSISDKTKMKFGFAESFVSLLHQHTSRREIYSGKYILSTAIIYLTRALSRRSQLKNLVLPMPSDCEIGWREHRPSIKGRNIFGMTLDSSFKPRTASMRFVFVTLVRIFLTLLSLR